MDKRRAPGYFAIVLSAAGCNTPAQKSEPNKPTAQKPVASQASVAPVRSCGVPLHYATAVHKVTEGFARLDRCYLTTSQIKSLQAALSDPSKFDKDVHARINERLASLSKDQKQKSRGLQGKCTIDSKGVVEWWTQGAIIAKIPVDGKNTLVTTRRNIRMPDGDWGTKFVLSLGTIEKNKLQVEYSCPMHRPLMPVWAIRAEDVLEGKVISGEELSSTLTEKVKFAMHTFYMPAWEYALSILPRSTDGFLERPGLNNGYCYTFSIPDDERRLVCATDGVSELKKYDFVVVLKDYNDPNLEFQSVGASSVTIRIGEEKNKGYMHAILKRRTKDGVETYQASWIMDVKKAREIFHSFNIWKSDQAGLNANPPKVPVPTDKEKKPN